MSVAVLYDIHGNLAALEAVIADARDQGARRYVLGGDYALVGPRPAETVERLRDLDARWIRGNTERWLADPGGAPDDPVIQGAIAAGRAELGEEVVAELAALPLELETEGARFVHASPVSDMESFLPEPAQDDARLLEGVRPGTLVFGHTHVQFRRRAGEVELVNPGSVGLPFDGDQRAAYALIDAGGELELRRVPYDHDAAALEVRERFGPGWAETIARRMATGRVSP